MLRFRNTSSATANPNGGANIEIESLNWLAVTKANLPDPKLYNLRTRVCSNASSTGGPCIVISNGSDWVRAEDSQVVVRA